MAKYTTPEQRQMFYRKHQAGQSYQEIADEYGVSREVSPQMVSPPTIGG